MLFPFNPLRLLAAFRKWTESLGVFELCFDVNSGEKLETLDRFFKKQAFNDWEELFNTVGRKNRNIKIFNFFGSNENF